MAFTSVPDNIIATLTDLGRTNFTRAANGEISFKLVGFAVGREGYNMANPVLVVPIITANTALLDQIFPVSGIKALESIEWPTPKTVVANCRLASTEAISALGEIGLWAEIMYSTIPAEIGTQFMLAVSHFPLSTKTNRQVVVYRIITQF